jgi:hypothetical protein
LKKIERRKSVKFPCSFDFWPFPILSLKNEKKVEKLDKAA